MPFICRQLPPRIDAESLWLLNRAARVTSQNGEDGIVRAIFEKLGVEDPWCIEFGAGDGHYLSNTWTLLNDGDWSGILIEAQEGKGARLETLYARNPKVHTFTERIAMEGPASLDAIFARTPMPARPDLMFVDVDGIDWHLWRSVRDYRPRVVVEFNPSMPNDLVYVQDADPGVREGSSVAAMVELGRELGYELAAVLEPNAFFVVREEFGRLGIPHNDLDTLRPRPPFGTELVQFYDGRVALKGYDRLIWKGTPIRMPEPAPAEAPPTAATGSA